MNSELIVDVQPQEVSIALTEDGRLVSLQKESRNLAYAVGDIYLAKVKKLMPGLNAAFVNVGYEKDAFLHYLDLGPHFSSYSDFLHQLLDDPKRPLPQVQKMKLHPDIDKLGTISEQITAGRELLVQIVKEPISSKGPRLTTEISFTGRYMVLIPFSQKISISQKIKTTAEKLRLRHLVDSIRPKNFGVIIRTSAEGKSVAELNHEMQALRQCWEETIKKARTAEVPSLIFEESSRIVGVLRDIFSPDFEAIHVNEAEAFTQIFNYVNLIAPDKKDIVKLYTKDTPIFDNFSITKQIKSSFGKTVSFKSGAYIIIEHTEALHVIDVNSGNRSKAGTDQESNALDVNLRAADEIARQLRLRDMGGIIVIDFIDMNKPEHRQALYEHMRQIMATDRARHNILPLSKFGLMQITRQRVRPALDIHTTETCPSCFGKGEVQPSLLFTDTLHDKLSYLIKDLKVRNFILYVHPFVEAYLKKGLISTYRRWKLELGGGFKIMADQSLAYLQYRVLDKNRNEIDIKEEKDLEKSSAEKTKTKAKNRVNQSQDSPDTDSNELPRENPENPKPAPKPKRQLPAPKPEKMAAPDQPDNLGQEKRAPRQSNRPPVRQKEKPQSDPSRQAPSKPEQPTATPRKEPSRPREEKAKPREETVKPREEKEKPREETVKLREDKVKPREEKVMPREETVKPREEKVKPREEKEKPREEKVKPREETVKPKGLLPMPE